MEGPGWHTDALVQKELATTNAVSNRVHTPDVRRLHGAPPQQGGSSPYCPDAAAVAGWVCEVAACDTAAVVLALALARLLFGLSPDSAPEPSLVVAGVAGVD